MEVCFRIYWLQIGKLASIPSKLTPREGIVSKLTSIPSGITYVCLVRKPRKMKGKRFFFSCSIYVINCFFYQVQCKYWKQLLWCIWARLWNRIKLIIGLLLFYPYTYKIFVENDKEQEIKLIYLMDFLGAFLCSC